uniref:GerMN domain-containing protein n=1 Tax=Agathobacter sp. TaxID=2021311 RepID=UPI0040565A69
MKKRLRMFLLCICFAFVFIGCGNHHADGEYQVYYLNIENSKIVPEGYDSSGATGKELIAEFLERLQTAPDSSKLRRTIPESVVVNGFNINEDSLLIDFGKGYSELSATQEILIRAAIVQTVLQESSISHVSFTVETEPLCNKSGSLVGSMNRESFVENPGKQINSAIETELTLYFASTDGTGLVKENREVHYSTNISVEKLIVEQLIGGPHKSGSKPTIPSETKIISVTVAEGVCYVNLDAAFYNQSPDIKEEVVLYSIVNSLTELQSVNKVQIAVNGDTKGKCRYTYELSKMYEANPELLAGKGES